MNILKLIRLQYLDYSLVLQIFLPLSRIIFREPLFYKLRFKHKTRWTISYACEIIKGRLNWAFASKFLSTPFHSRSLHPFLHIHWYNGKLWCKRIRKPAVWATLNKTLKQNIKHKMSFTTTLAICMKQTRLNTYIILKKDWSRVFTVL